MLKGFPALSSDGWAGLSVFVFSAVLFFLTIGLPDMPLVPVGPGFYPRIVLGFTALLGLWLLVADARRERQSQEAAQPLTTRLLGFAGHYQKVVLHFSLFAVYIAAMSGLGFRISTLAYVAASSYLLDPPRSPKAWLRIVLLALIAAFVTFFVFERYLAVLLPRGRWTSF